MSDNMKIDKLENGTINISDEVIAIITSIAVTEVEGVHGFHGGFANDFAEKLGFKGSKKGVGIRVDDNEVFVTLHLVMEYGQNISKVAMKVQSKVKTVVEEMTELTVKTVDVFIDAINISNKKVKDVEVEDIELEKNTTEDEKVVDGDLNELVLEKNELDVADTEEKTEVEDEPKVEQYKTYEG